MQGVGSDSVLVVSKVIDTSVSGLHPSDWTCKKEREGLRLRQNKILFALVSLGDGGENNVGLGEAKQCYSCGGLVRRSVTCHNKK